MIIRRTNRIQFGLLFLIPALLVAGCRQSAGGVPVDRPETTGVQIALTADHDPHIMRPLVWNVTLLDADGRPVEDATVTIRGDMSHAGMAPVEATAAHSGDGIYTADFEWTMTGDWIVTVTATLAGGNVVSQIFDFTVRSQ